MPDRLRGGVKDREEDPEAERRHGREPDARRLAVRQFVRVVGDRHHRRERDQGADRLEPGRLAAREAEGDGTTIPSVPIVVTTLIEPSAIAR